MSFLWMISFILLAVFFIAFSTVKKEGEQNKSLNSQFECGFILMNPSHVPFSFQFFLIALLFLIFDIEIALVISYPLEPKTIKNLGVIISFLMILFVGLSYEWQKSKLDWSK